MVVNQHIVIKGSKNGSFIGTWMYYRRLREATKPSRSKFAQKSFFKSLA